MFNKIKDWFKKTFTTPKVEAPKATQQRIATPAYKPQAQSQVQTPSFQPKTLTIDATKTDLKPAPAPKVVKPVEQITKPNIVQKIMGQGMSDQQKRNEEAIKTVMAENKAEKENRSTGRKIVDRTPLGAVLNLGKGVEDLTLLSEMLQNRLKSDGNSLAPSAFEQKVAAPVTNWAQADEYVGLQDAAKNIDNPILNILAQGGGWAVDNTLGKATRGTAGLINQADFASDGTDTTKADLNKSLQYGGEALQGWGNILLMGEATAAKNAALAAGATKREAVKTGAKYLLGRAGKAYGTGATMGGVMQTLENILGTRQGFDLGEINQSGMRALSNTGAYEITDKALDGVLKYGAKMVSKLGAKNVPKIMQALIEDNTMTYISSQGGHLLTKEGIAALGRMIGMGMARGLAEVPIESLVDPALSVDMESDQSYGERVVEQIPQNLVGNVAFGGVRGLTPGFKNTGEVLDTINKVNPNIKLNMGIPGTKTLTDILDPEIRGYAKDLEDIDAQLRASGQDAGIANLTDAELQKVMAEERQAWKEQESAKIIDDTKTDLQQDNKSELTLIEEPLKEILEEKYNQPSAPKESALFESGLKSDSEIKALENQKVEQERVAAEGKIAPEYRGDISRNPLQKIADWVKEPARMYQNLTQTDGDYKLIEDKIIKGRQKAAADYNRFIDSQKTAMKEAGFTIKSGSKDSKLMGEFLQGNMTKDDLVAEVGENRAAKIINESSAVSKFYQASLVKANEMLRAQGLPEIPDFGKDYLRGYAEGRSILDINPSGKTSASGQSLYNKKTGKGGLDIIRGINDWNSKAGNLITFGKVVQDAIDLSNKFGEEGQDTLSNYLKWHADQIAGVTQKSNNPVTASLTNLLMKMAGAAKGAKVSGNISTIISQIASMPLGTADAGVGNTAKSFFSTNADNWSMKSNYLEGNKGSQVGDFEPGSLTKILSKGTNFVDYQTKKIIWKAEFEKGKSQGMSDNKAYEFAEKITPLVMGDRTRGSYSPFQSSTIGKIIAPFTTEVQAQANRKLEVLLEKSDGGLKNVSKSVLNKLKFFTTLAASTYAYNNVAELIMGQRPGNGDYIQAAMDAYDYIEGTDEQDKSYAKAAARIVSEVGNDLSPAYYSTLVSAAQLTQVFYEDETGEKSPLQDILGSEDPTRFGSAYSMYNPFKKYNVTGNNIVDHAIGVVSQYAPGGNQLRKTLQGISALNRGAVESKNGKIMFETPEGTGKSLQQILFGPSSTKEAREYYGNEFTRPLSETETEAYYSLPENKRSQYYNSVEADKIATSKTNKEIAKIKKDGGAEEVGSISANGKMDSNAKKLAKAQIDAGIVLSKADNKAYFFSGYDAESDSVRERKEVYSNLRTLMNSEDYTDEQKQAVLAASGASQENWDYYDMAAYDGETKLQDFIIPQISQMESLGDVYDFLYQNRKEIGNKKILDNTMLEYLADRGYIPRDMAKQLKKVFYDEIKQEFWEEQASGSGYGSGNSTANKLAKAPFQGYQDLAKIMAGAAKGGRGFSNSPVNYSQYAGLTQGVQVPNEVYKAQDRLAQILGNTRQKQDKREKITL